MVDCPTLTLLVRPNHTHDLAALALPYRFMRHGELRPAYITDANAWKPSFILILPRSRVETQ